MSKKPENARKTASTQILTLPIGEIRPYEKNPRKNENAVKYVKESIRQFGFKVPIVIDSNRVIVCGHTRLLAAKSLGLTEVPCIMADDLTDDQIKAFRLADNKVGEFAEWDLDLLGDELDAIADASDIDMGDFGFDLSDDDEEKEIVEDEVPEDADPVVKPGEIWILGEHRLMCGDSTDPAAIDRLMDGVKADMVFTDPPYNVAMSRSKVDGSDNSIKNDDLSEDDYIELLQGAFSNALFHCNSHNMYWWIGFRQYSTLEKIFKDNDVKIANCIVWDKGSIGLGGKGYRYQHELCIFCGEINNNSASDVWKFDRSTEGIHPTMKPIALVANAIQNIADVKSVLDLFGGSGSTLIACEQLNRKCYMCELDPHYCDVIIARWEQLTGKKAVNMEE